MNKKLFIFDWDGTILDSANKIVACMQLAMADAELEVLAAKPIEQIIGLGMQEATDTLYPHESVERKLSLQQHYARHFVAADHVACEFFPGCKELLVSLRADRCLTAVATGKSRRGLNRVFEATGVGHLFDASRCADETASKPHPLMLEQLLDELKVEASDAVMIGDTSYDLEMAVSAGVTPIGVSHGVHSVEQLNSAGAVFVANSYAQLGAWLRSQYRC